MLQREFRFKRFKLQHGGSSFPIGTDAVILGAYAGKHIEARNIIDIGTGSGIIALMLAQRFETALVHAVEINPDAFVQARENFSQSPFFQRLAAFNMDIREFQLSTTYDLIVCNPPYFSDSLKSPNEMRTRSKHDDNDLLPKIFEFASKKLNQDGLMQIIYPTESIDMAIELALKKSLYCIVQLNILPSPDKKAVRSVLSFSRKKTSFPEHNILSIENGRRHDYHKDYLELCKDFYLKFPD
jgi:tRNA1Val (adenine37-N6)-methyltransferase